MASINKIVKKKKVKKELINKFSSKSFNQIFNEFISFFKNIIKKKIKNNIIINKMASINKIVKNKIVKKELINKSSPKSLKQIFNELEKIVNDDKHKLKPVIINPNSNFVVISYWWGRGNVNYNTQKPCREFYKALDEENKKRTEKNQPLKPIPPLEEEPITFEAMVEQWKANMIKMKCNYLIEEYPEFAKPQGYQQAINCKPIYMKKALEACNGRSIVYIDCDMFIWKYPNLFDIKNVDYAARNWNSDPRGGESYADLDETIEDRTCFDSNIMEPSGGIMFFGSTPGAFEILDQWVLMSKKEINKGKADDRIISILLNSDGFAAKYNIIQLPIEYLYLSDYYDDFLTKKDINKIIVEHPACLTSEDTATALGASNDRMPKYYKELVSNKINCDYHGGIFYEYIYFEDVGIKGIDDAAESYQVYFKIIKHMKSQFNAEINELIPSFYLVPMYKKYKRSTIKQIYGKNEVSTNNRIKKSLKFYKYYPKPTFEDKLNIQFISYGENCIPKILAALKQNYDIFYIPKYLNKSITNTSIKSIIANKPDDIELITFVDSDLYSNSPNFENDKPFYFSHKSNVLYHLVAMSTNIEISFNNHFNSSFIFLSRIRCLFLNSDDIKTKKNIFKTAPAKISKLITTKFPNISGKSKIMK
jgi:hypothetical protein